MNSLNSIFLIFISIGGFFFFTKPMLADLSALSDKKTEYQSSLEKLNSIEEIQKGLTEKLDSLGASEKEKLETLLPDSPGSVKLAADIDGMASRHGISVDKISYTKKNDDQGQSIAGAPAGKTFQSTMLTFSFTSDYSHLKNFLSELESSLRLLDLRSIDLTVGEKGVYNYNLSAEVYSLNSNP